MSITIQKIAEIAGVSRGTVDRVLHNRGRVAPDISEKIRGIAEENGYIPKHPLGRTARKDAIVTIGIVTQLSHSPFMRRVNQGIEDITRELARQNVRVIHEETPTVDEAAQLNLINRLAGKNIHGLAIMPVDSDQIRVRLSELTKGGIPVITFNSDIPGTGRLCFVGLDNKKSGRTAAGLMGLMTGGSGKILTITGYFSNNASSMRVDGFIEECRKSFPGMELAGVQSSFDNAAEVERIIRDAMEDGQRPGGIFVTSGGQTGIWKAFEAIKPQKRPKVIIYDRTAENETALLQDSADFLIDQDGYVQGYRPLKLLWDLLLNGRVPEAEYIYTDITILTKYNL